MGLGIAQVRLLALTHRKSDIELEMSIDSKRKQQLTRKSTELAHDYYAKLNNYNYQYSTTGGFNDLDYNYLMGECNANGTFTKRFLNQILYGTGDVDTKIDNRVILTDSKGQVILNNQLANCVEAASIYNYDGLYDDASQPTVADQTAFAIWNFVASNTTEQGYAGIVNNFTGGIESGNADFDVLEDMNKIIEIIKILMENGGVSNGGNLYVYMDSAVNAHKFLGVTGGLVAFADGSTESYDSAVNNDFEAISTECAGNNAFEDPNNAAKKASLKPGACYTVYNISSGTPESTCVQQCLWDGEKFVPNLRLDYLQKLSNIIDYLAPMLSAALQNGYSGSGNAHMNQHTDFGGSTEASIISHPSATTSEGAHTVFCAYADDPSTSGGYGKFIAQCQAEFEKNGDGSYKAGQYKLAKIYNADHTYCHCFACWVDNDGFHNDWATNPSFNNFLRDKYYAELNASNAGHFSGILMPIGDASTSFYATGGYVKPEDWVKDNTLTEEVFNDYLQDGECGYFGGLYYAKINGQLIKITQQKFNSLTNSSGSDSSCFDDVQEVSTLQDGLKSGVYQLCMVDNVNTGVYHKNTTMDYFIHRNLCVEKIDMSKREELTAWYNAEQAALSDQENYWDEEITNLSTELTAVKQEIDSVKSLKSNAIKSVFGWGGN